MTTFSVLLGYTSIGCWLGAQFPQVVENIRRRSCEGLALPFLLNWLLGDISNLVGCLLTHQLPFQTWLATYFMLVDFTLFGQFFYYQYTNPPRRTSTLRRMSTERNTPRYRTLSAVAANVAVAAALAAQHDEHPPSRRNSRWTQSSRDRNLESSTSRISGELDEPVDESALAALADSFHSEGGQTLGRNRVSWSTERSYGRRGTSVGRYPALSRGVLPNHSLQTSFTEGVGSSTRGRTLQRDEGLGEEPSIPASPSLGRSSRVNRQGAGMVFLSVFAVFGVVSQAGNRPWSLSSVSNGKVIFPRAVDEIAAVTDLSPPHAIPTPSYVQDVASETAQSYTVVSVSTTLDSYHYDTKFFDTSDERFIGRIFAWVCTTLYLTSRLPQIWKNFARKSVEGLSIYLFIFAFLGNTFYVASILTSPEVFLPPPISTHFIKESIPYLLGSGGTLMFDITIVAQSLVYRPKPRRRSSRQSRMAQEESGLLSGDSLAQPPYSADENNVHARGPTSSTRTAV